MVQLADIPTDVLAIIFSYTSSKTIANIKNLNGTIPFHIKLALPFQFDHVIIINKLYRHTKLEKSKNLQQAIVYHSHSSHRQLSYEFSSKMIFDNLKRVNFQFLNEITLKFILSKYEEFGNMNDLLQNLSEVDCSNIHLNLIIKKRINHINKKYKEFSPETVNLLQKFKWKSINFKTDFRIHSYILVPLCLLSTSLNTLQELVIGYKVDFGNDLSQFKFPNLKRFICYNSGSFYFNDFMNNHFRTLEDITLSVSRVRFWNLNTFKKLKKIAFLNLHHDLPEMDKATLLHQVSVITVHGLYPKFDLSYFENPHIITSPLHFNLDSKSKKKNYQNAVHDKSLLTFSVYC
ncbi:uncharacterized protein RJT21DRAFT_132203 [Scheffersomyces amazonensis]|uniref:uncharacterized protein n=1 Tax=Scheffersomyces amazonensis TaxID=1078765 RepID=UPI00315D43B7